MVRCDPAAWSGRQFWNILGHPGKERSPACDRLTAEFKGISLEVISSVPPEPRPTHDQLILDQFTRQALPFSEAPAISDQAAVDVLIQLTQASPADVMLDVACGPGLVALAFAPCVAHVTGIDLTPAMIDRAKTLQKERNVNNVNWKIGDVTRLPFDEGEFSLVLTRYSIHHFPDPRAVIAEMCRVCKPGGVVAVVDTFTCDDPAKAEAFNSMEKLRDPSHVRALTLRELQSLLYEAGIVTLRSEYYKLPTELEQLLKVSFPRAGDADRIRDIFASDLKRSELGLEVHRRETGIHLAYPIAALAGRKA
jgi:ubiquinone/menaquinone biosynthesis C-methylase UbiE